VRGGNEHRHPSVGKRNDALSCEAVQGVGSPEDVPGASLLASLGPERKKRKPTASRTKQNLAAAIAELDDVLKKQHPAEPKHLVALYVRAHESVYEVFPEELRTPTVYMGAVSAAKKLVADAFDGDIDATFAFMRWVWQEERGLTKWKRAKGIVIKRVEWRKQFVYRDLVTDYRTAMIEGDKRRPKETRA
jgi:hypothetical protein